MKGKTWRLVCVGKIKSSYWREAAEHYLGLLKRWRSLEVEEIRDGDAALPVKERVLQEARRILPLLDSGEPALCLAETGRQFSSKALADFLEQLDRQCRSRITFVIGGPFGHDQTILDKCPYKLSLSSMTWPHELARVLLLEQLFRAESILRRFPYHN